MKKLVVSLVVLAMIFSFAFGAGFSCFAAETDPEGLIESGGKTWKVVSEDLLAASSLGNPAAVTALNGDSWLGHESWNGTRGWDGFRGGDNLSVREVVTTTLSDGSEGKAIRFAANPNGSSGSQFGIENVDLICGFENGKYYIAEVVEKISEGFNGNGHNPIIAFNQTECEAHGAAVVTPTVDGQWHTYYTLPFENVAANWNSDGRKDEGGTVIGGVFLNVGVGENWINPGTELFFESVKIYEVEEYEEPDPEGNWLVNPTFDATTGWGGWATYAVDSDADHTGDETDTIVYAAGTAHGHCSQEFTFKAGKTYYVSVWVKVSEDYAMNTDGFNGIGIGIGTGGGWEIRPDGCSIVNSNDNLPYEWTQFKGEFTPAEDMTGLFSIFCWGKAAGQVWFDDAYLGTDPVPEIDYPRPGNWLVNPTFDGTTGWGGWTTYAVDSDADHTGDETDTIVYAADTTHGHCSQEFTFKAGKTYYVSVWAKVSEDFAMNTEGFNGIGIGIGTGGSWGIYPAGCSIVNSNDNLPYKWTQFKGEFTPAEDMTGLFSIFCWGKTAGQVWFDDAYLGTDPVPEIEYPEEPEEPEDKYVACGNAEVLIITEEDVIVIEDIIPAEADNTVNLCIPDITDNDYTDLFVSQDAFEKILEAVGEDGTLTVDYGPFCLVFDAKAVEYIWNSTNEGDIDIDAMLYEEDGEVCLDIDIYEYIEDDEGNYEYLPFHEFGEGTVTAKIAFEIPEGTSADDYKVFVLSGDGRIPVEATFADGICEFDLPHLSTFVIAYNPQTSDASFAIAIAIVMTFCLAVVVIKRKRVTSK